MQILIDKVTAIDYFAYFGKSIDFLDDDSGDISEHQASKINEILSIEASIYALMRCTEICDSNIESLRDIRSRLIDKYNVCYEDYQPLNDFQ